MQRKSIGHILLESLIFGILNGIAVYIILKITGY